MVKETIIFILVTAFIILLMFSDYLPQWKPKASSLKEVRERKKDVEAYLRELEEDEKRLEAEAREEAEEYDS